MDKIEAIREKIGECDDIIIEQLAVRMSYIQEIISYKKATGIPILQPEQEKKQKARIIRQEQQISRLTNKVMEQSSTIERLQEKAVDLGRLERYFGREQVQSIVEQSKALERAEKANKRPKRAFEISR